MRIDVAFLKGEAFDQSRSVYIVVDVLRASSSMVTLLERGARPLVAASSVEEARALHTRLSDYLLCGERSGLPPPGFDYGNSPAEFSRLQFEGRGVILATSNGTRLLADLSGAPAVLAGCLLNRTAAAKVAMEMARGRRLDILVACSAASAGATFVLEDALGAGAIVDAALASDALLQASDAARFARDAFRAVQGDLQAAIASSYHAGELKEADLGDDVAYCAQLDVSEIVPVLQRLEDGALALLPGG